jgi:hypothetical protein
MGTGGMEGSIVPLCSDGASFAIGQALAAEGGCVAR